jgi:hypothetical protein
MANPDDEDAQAPVVDEVDVPLSPHARRTFGPWCRRERRLDHRLRSNQPRGRRGIQVPLRRAARAASIPSISH